MSGDPSGLAAWKPAAVTSGVSLPTLLDSYDAERRPIAWLRHQQIFARADFKPFASPSQERIIDDAAMELGQLYRSSAVLGACPELPPAQRPEQWRGQPATRAPHLWLRDGGTTLDLFGRGWVLLADATHWQPIAAEVSARLGVELTCLTIDHDVSTQAPSMLREAFGLAPAGAALIRPDGYVAWRAQGLSADPAAELLAAVRCVASPVRANLTLLSSKR
jgi:putative polyketide hydroxylase